MSVDRCAADIMKVLDGRQMTEDELRTIGREVQRRARVLRDLDQAKAEADILADAATSVTDDVRRAALIERRNRGLRIMVFTQQMDYIAQAIEGGASLKQAFQGILVGSDVRLAGGRKSIDQTGASTAQEIMAGMMAKLQREDLVRFVTDRQGIMGQGAGPLELEIATEMRSVSAGEPSSTGSKEARRIAEIFHETQEIVRLRQNRYGAAIGSRWDYIVRQVHDQAHVWKARKRLGITDPNVDNQKAWVEFIKPLLDEEETFGGIDPTEFLNGAYENIRHGEHLRVGDQAPHDIKFVGPSNLAKKVSLERVLHFKDAESWYEYNKVFGSRSMVESMFHGIEQGARNAAMLQILGPNPEEMFNKLWKNASRKWSNEGRLRQNDKDRLDNFYKEVDGTTMQISSITLHHIASTFRAQQSWSKLGAATLSSITDVPTMVSEMRWQDQNFGSALGEILDELSRMGRNDPELAELLAIGLDHIPQDVAARFSQTDNLTGVVSKINRLYYKANLLQPWTAAMKRAVARVMARRMSMRLEGRFDDLSDRFKEVMGLYGIGPDQWRVLQQAEQFAADGRNYLTTDAVRNLDEAALRPLVGNELDEIDLSIDTKRLELEERLAGEEGDAADATQRQITNLESQRSRRRNAKITRAREELADSLQIYYMDRSDHAVPTPGARERAIINQGSRRGTWEGEFLRLIGQFKMFPITVLTKNVARDLNGLQGGFPELMRSGKGDLAGLAAHIAMVTTFGLVAMQLKEIAKGRNPRPITQENARNVFFSAMLQGGGLGIFGDFLFGEYTRFGGTPLQTAAGPGFSTLSDFAALLADFNRGEWENLRGDALRFAQSNTPFINMFYTRAVIDYLVMYRLTEMVNPGYLRRLERRTLNNNNQTFFIPPTSVLE